MKTQAADSTPKVSDAVFLGQGLRIFISSKFSDETAAADLGNTLWVRSLSSPTVPECVFERVALTAFRY